jgi:AAA family ATP:ADP antiporter
VSSKDPTVKQSRGINRLLNLFADVRKGESATVLLLTFNIFLILTAYYIMKPVREALILAGGGAELKSYMSAGQTFLLLFTVPLYAKLVSRFSRRRLINGVTVFFALCIGIFYLLARADISLGIAFYLWVGIFNVSVIAQFWSFANDVYSPGQGKRLFAIVGFGASSGAVFGPFIAGRLIEPIGEFNLFLIAGLILLMSLILTNIVDSREKVRIEARGKPDDAVPEEEPIGKEGAYKLIFQNRYLLLIALLILFLNWVNTTGEYILGRVVSEEAIRAVAGDPGMKESIFIGKFYSDFYLVVNFVGLGIQLFLVSRILKYLGVRAALLFLPVIALFGYAMIIFLPVLGLIRWTKTAENATDYSLQNTLRGVLFLPTTREQKYKAKQAIDTIFVRGGDALSALLVFVGTTFLAFQTEHFAIVNLVFVVIWIILAIFTGRHFSRLTN